MSAARRLPSAHAPHTALVLGIDPGRVSGWALSTPHVDVIEAGTVTTHEERVSAVRTALWASRTFELPLVVVAEKWTPGGWHSHATVVGLGAEWGAWRAALESEGVAKRRVIRVFPSTWRSELGIRGRTTAQFKAGAVAYVRVRTGRDLPPDAAEAACIALFGRQAGEVGAVLSKKRKGTP